MLKKFIGDKAFYRMALSVALPMMAQNAITNFVNLLDNIMVGQVGTYQMTGVSVTNQILLVFALCIFGASSGAGIFTAQYYGKNDNEGIRQTIRYKIGICLLITIIGIILFLFSGEWMISAFLQGEGTEADRATALLAGKQYLMIMLIGLFAFSVNNAYASTMRETGQTVVPMVASIVAVITNLVCNYLLIFGNFGFPKLGVIGAAIATVMSRFAEFGVNFFWLHSHSDRYPYIKDLYRSVYITPQLFKNITVKGMPLFINEFFWSGGMVFLNQCYSSRGIAVVSALTISTTLRDLFSVCYLTLGVATGIIMGQMMGAGKSEDEIKDSNRKLITFSVFSCTIFGGIMAAISGIFPQFYNTEENVRSIATAMICIYAAYMPIGSFMNAAYFTLRSGGKTLITFIFDSGFVWAISVPGALILTRLTDLPIIPIYALTLSLDLFKCIAGFIMIKQGKWIQNIVVPETE